MVLVRGRLQDHESSCKGSKRRWLVALAGSAGRWCRQVVSAGDVGEVTSASSVSRQRCKLYLGLCLKTKVKRPKGRVCI